MNVLKIIFLSDLTESSRKFLSNLQNQSGKVRSLEETDFTGTGAYKLYEYSSKALEMSGTVIFTPDAYPDDERASVLKHFCGDDTPYAYLSVSVLDEVKSQASFISSFSDTKFLHDVLGIIIRATKTMENKLKIYLAARNDSTLDNVNDLIKEIVKGQDLDVTLHVERIRISTSGDEELLKQKLSDSRSCKVLCCVDKSSRNIILHETEPDEASQIVLPAEENCGKDGVLLLLRGHRDIDGGDLYDKEYFSTSFLRHQPKLRQMVESGRFLSMKSSLNESQKKAVLEWIQRPPDDSMKQPSNEGTVQCPTNQEITQNAARKQSTGIFANLLSKFANTENVT